MTISLRTSLRILLACCVVGLVVPFALGYTYSDRLATRPSVNLVPVADSVTRPATVPRRAVVVVFDGLGYKEALGMRSLQLLRERGQCWKTDVGSLPMSRPVYAVLSTGVEQDRGGALINDATAPHDAESVWNIARAAGLYVAAVSELPWWQQLFPSGFASYLMPPRSADYFRLAPRADLLLIHPLYIDEAGHSEGAGSEAYREAVARADRELLSYLPTLDLERDLLVVTADHGHSLLGGHGGRQDRIANVLSCFAGVGVQKRAELGALQMTSVGPALTLLLGLHFPAAMRAGDDDLAALWELADPGFFPAAYLTDRHQAVERFRVANQAQVSRWAADSGGSWNALYATARRDRLLKALPLVFVLGLVFVLHRRGHHWLRGLRHKRGGFPFGLFWLLCCGVVAYALQVLLRGSFDMSSINHREGFIRFTVTLGLSVSLGALGLPVLLRRSLRALVWDLSMMSLFGTVLSLAHPLILGWHLGFPVPAPPLFFFPYFAALFLAVLNGIGLLVCVAGWTRQRWKSGAAREVNQPSI